ncbi:MAG TPA: SDR family NAD(P)-dependent oxidoreductase [Gaiellaceae bacterium]|nr:SDR family NAD(P)-dependent oxidoreductase [Gaiellaceae bacterium]
MELAGAVCLVTGASSGIGRATAQRLVAEGAEVLALGRNPNALEATGGRPIVCDLTDDDAVAAAVETAGPVDVLVNNAGIGWAGPFAELDAATLDRLVRINLVAPVLLTSAFLPGMLERGRGHVVNVGSIVGLVGAKDEAGYASTKGGLVAFTESLRQELSDTQVKVSLVTPGAIATAFFERRGTPYLRRFPRTVPPVRVADAILDAIRHDRDEVYVPRWLAFPPRFHSMLPGLYRALAARFG